MSLVFIVIVIAIFLSNINFERDLEILEENINGQAKSTFNVINTKPIEIERNIILNKNLSEDNIIENKNIIKKTIVDKYEKPKERVEKEKGVWKIEIPSINLIAQIEKGTSKNVMDRYVGHFENTAVFFGNVGLAAHNRGYPVNYFRNVKDLKENDLIIYTTEYGKKTYVVDKNIVIKDTDWSYLESSNENKITLVTCVENKPDLRRCVQASEKQ